MKRLVDLSKLLASDELTRTKLADETGVVLDVDSLQVYTLNETGMFLVEALGSGIDEVDALVSRLVEHFEVDEDTARADVRSFLDVVVQFLVEGRSA